MYNLSYKRSDGLVYAFDSDMGIFVSTVSGLTGHAVTISTSQGFNQIGETVTGTAIKGQSITINGIVLDQNTVMKTKMLNAFAPNTHGTLYINGGQYWLDVYTQTSPTVTQEKHSRFSLSLFAPFPFWQSKNQSIFAFGSVLPMFSFPVNYSVPHQFAQRDQSLFVNLDNRGDTEVSFALDVVCTAAVSSITFTHTQTFEKLELIGEFKLGDRFKMYRENGILRATLERGGEMLDAFYLINEDSNLFSIGVGDNVISIDADPSPDYVQASFSFYNAYAGVLSSGV